MQSLAILRHPPWPSILHFKSSILHFKSSIPHQPSQGIVSACAVRRSCCRRQRPESVCHAPVSCLHFRPFMTTMATTSSAATGPAPYAPTEQQPSQAHGEGVDPRPPVQTHGDRNGDGEDPRPVRTGAAPANATPVSLQPLPVLLRRKHHAASSTDERALVSAFQLSLLPSPAAFLAGRPGLQAAVCSPQRHLRPHRAARACPASSAWSGSRSTAPPAHLRCTDCHSEFALCRVASGAL